MSTPDEQALAGCLGKWRFGSHSEAMRVQKRRGKKRDAGKRDQEAYRCRFCHGWHLGSNPDRFERPKHEWKRYRRRYESERV